MIVNEYYREAAKNPRTVIFICGPTASGKTGLSLKLAEKLGGEIVSCDSMQIYRFMDVGTAKATAEEQSVAPHHMIDVVNPWDTYNVFQYKEAAEKCIDEILYRGNVPIITGGTGLYVNSIVENRQYTESGCCEELNADVAEKLQVIKNLYDSQRFEDLYQLLKEVDPQAAEKIHCSNKKRVFRALELYFTTGKVQAERNEESLAEPSKYNCLVYCLSPERELLYDRINRRVDLMFEKGLFDEAVFVYNMCKEKVGEGFSAEKLTALQAIGYKELIPLIENNYVSLETEDFCQALESAKDAIKQNSRRYAKRQVTWFKRTPCVRFLTEIEL
jgi:tRNA dimethylallyltransferase